ncbi:hypothetical protein DFP72DRAFT_73205 [Ephemerocybe angulata]|uniref:Uncharacterized protein n=1 Tax=Ephemerocybe angulata TaxID=980116 RepID=A0A8H6I7S2_9AGAR|nr:hypothetical protein DFP72DRAFT_73205 [Tulosesus angulatus]
MDLLDESAGATGADTPLHILSGSFRSISLALLAFYPLNRTLEHVTTVPAFGPHQYLALNAGKDVVYTTSWADPPILSSWSLLRSEHGHGTLVEDVKHLNTVKITATSSYISVPPPYDFVYSTGGPTGEVHTLAPDGSFGEKIQQYLFVPEDELETTDKTPVALRYGSHGVEFSSSGYGFIPVLGTSTIEMYRRDSSTGRLDHVFSSRSPRGSESHDGPRHVKVHPNGKILYCLTEHNNLLDVYEINSTQGSLTYLTSHSILPLHVNPGGADDPKFRGDTLMLTPPNEAFPAPVAIFTTTRGATSETRGWMSVFRLDKDGHVQESAPGGPAEEHEGRQKEEVTEAGVLRFETPTSGGRANALDIKLKSGKEGGYWILLTDDDQQADRVGAVRVLEWDGWGDGGEGKPSDLRVVAEWPKDGYRQEDETPGREEEQDFKGASHAIWLD